MAATDRALVEGLECRRLMHAGHEHTTLRVDAAGSGTFTDAAGNAWSADANFTGGSANTGVFAVANTPDDALYSTRRTGVFSYAAAVENGSYKLRLLFADWHADAGKRRFNVDIEGARVLTNFDIAAQVGRRTALDKTFDLTIADGTLNLSFTRGTAADPTLSGFELLPVDAPPPTAPAAPSELYARPASDSRIDLVWSDGSNNETGFEIERAVNGGTWVALTTVGAGITSYADQGVAAQTRHVYRVRAINAAGESAWSNEADATTLPPPEPGAAGTTVLRVDAVGSGNFTDAAGKVWRSDAFFTGGSANTGVWAVSGTTDDALFSTRRTGVFSYSAAAEDGDYVLRLLFTDHHTAANKRRFNVDVEGTRVLTNFDIVAEVGSRAALVKTYNVRITDGALDLVFTRGTLADPTLSAFELVPAGDGGAPTTGAPAAPSGLDATGLAGDRIRVTWQDNAGNEDNFQLERSTNGAPFVRIATLARNVTSYDDAGRNPDKTYAYRVRAANASGTSAFSNTDAAQALGPWAFTKVSWSSAASAPVGKAEALRAVVDGKLYVFAGFAGSAGPVVRSDVYNPATNSWTRIADMPRRLSHAGAAVEGRNVYFAGGYVGTGPGYTQQFGTREVWRYNTVTNTYHAMPQLPTAVASGGLVTVGRNLHYFGGNNSSRQDVAVHYVLNLDNTAAGWATKKSMNVARSHMGYANLGGKVYAVGGQKGNDGALVAQNVVEMYDPATDTWTARKAMPKGINHISGSTFVMAGRIIVLGGQTSHGSSLADAYAYDPVANTWTSLTPLPAARFSGVAAAINGSIYFTGGSSQTTTWKGNPS